jgi:hypothetical protein
MGFAKFGNLYRPTFPSLKFGFEAERSFLTILVDLLYDFLTRRTQQILAKPSTYTPASIYTSLPP